MITDDQVYQLQSYSTQNLMEALVIRIQEDRLAHITANPYIYDDNYSSDEFIHNCQNILRDKLKQEHVNVFVQKISDRFTNRLNIT
jgi:hypothetical protein